MARFVVTSGPLNGQAFPIKDELVIGRDPAACQLRLTADDQVSRQHAHVKRGPRGVWILRDLGSANGSWLVNGRGERRRLQGDYTLDDGDQVEVGSTRLVFAEEAYAAAGAPPVGVKRPMRRKIPSLPLIAISIASIPMLLLSALGLTNVSGQSCGEREAVDRIRHSTVMIVATFQQGRVTGSGSGFVLTQDGYIMTNRHVILDRETRQPPQKIVVLMPGQERQLPAKLIQSDPVVDLALLKTEGIPNLKPIKWAKSSSLHEGDPVITAGFPMPSDNRLLGEATFTFGRVSAHRVFQGAEFVQHDAEVNHGNSGGPLVNRCGEVVGVNTQVAYEGENESRAPGLNFSIEQSIAQSKAQQWLPLR